MWDMCGWSGSMVMWVLTPMFTPYGGVNIGVNVGVN